VRDDLPRLSGNHQFEKFALFAFVVLGVTVALLLVFLTTTFPGEPCDNPECLPGVEGNGMLPTLPPTPQLESTPVPGIIGSDGLPYPPFGPDGSPVTPR